MASSHKLPHVILCAGGGGGGELRMSNKRIYLSSPPHVQSLWNSPSNTRRRTNAGLMLAYCLCCWANINPALVQLLAFVWISLCLRDTPGPGFLLSGLLLYEDRHLASGVEPLTRWYLSDKRTTISRPLRRRQISCAARLRAVMRTGSLCIVSGTWFLSSCSTSGRW